MDNLPMQPCTAEDSDGEECDCGSFAPKQSEPKKCRRCLHARRHHHLASTEELRMLAPSLARHQETEAKALRLKAKSKAKIVRESPSVTAFKVDGIVILPNGLVELVGYLSLHKAMILRTFKNNRMVLEDPCPPNRVHLQILINTELAVLEPAQIEFAVGASHDEVMETTAAYLAGPMQYFSALGPEVLTHPDTGEYIEVNRQQLEVAEVARPEGKDLHFHGVTTADHKLIYIARQAIPVEEQAAWRNQDAFAFTTGKVVFDDDKEMAQMDDSLSSVCKRTRHKRLSSIAVNTSNEDSLTDATTKARRTDSNTYIHLISSFSNMVSCKWASNSQSVGGSGTDGHNTVAGPSREPIDLTVGSSSSRENSPFFPFFLLTPPQKKIVDPSFSDPTLENPYSSYAMEKKLKEKPLATTGAIKIPAKVYKAREDVREEEHGKEEGKHTWIDGDMIKTRWGILTSKGAAATGAIIPAKVYKAKGAIREKEHRKDEGKRTWIDGDMIRTIGGHRGDKTPAKAYKARGAVREEEHRKDEGKRTWIDGDMIRTSVRDLDLTQPSSGGVQE
ncbi:hypothetical protein C8J57DRAFT_1250744 [Mycena rebaudengoi]|nr:hypothetical protein C8J57DRAFT_1250744 [Mycena rebaudengoi]